MILKIASESLQKNIISLPSGKFVTAGQNQFLTLWTRDFCHAIRGLIALGEVDVAKNHLTYLLNNLREDGLVPRVVDNRIVQFRVAYQSFRKLVPIFPKLAIKEPLRPQYVDEHGSHAFDSNVLVVLSALQLGEEFYKEHEERLKKVWHWYEDKFRDGLIYQAPFADWQDTTKREGHTFLLNLFYFLAASRLQKYGMKTINLDEYKKKIVETFYKDGLFISQVGYPQVSVEAHLFLLEAEEFLNPSEKKALWEKLKAHPIITLDGAIGRCSYPDWPEEDLAWHIKFANLKRYHGSLSWSWLMGFGLRVATLMDDHEMVRQQTNHIEAILTRDGEVHEVYDPQNNFMPWKSWLLTAEHPFAWGSSYLTEALIYK